jgi:SAM-dependent methyltransferase
MKASTETHFSSDQRRLAYPAGYERHYWHLAKRNFLDGLLARFEPGPILDVGCGDGIYADHLRRLGYRAFGVDRGIGAVPGFLFDGGLAEVPAEIRASIRTVLLSDVIEHVENERHVLGECLERLPALEHIVLTVPARKELWSNYDRHYGHFRRYSLAGLEQAVSRDGSLRVLASGYFFHLLYVPAWLLASRDARPVSIDAPGKAAEPLHRLLGWLLAAESRWLPASWPGTSAFALCAVQRA